MASHESIYGLLGACMKEGERYSLALTSPRACWGGKMPEFFELPGKNKQDFIGESASHRVLMGNSRLLSERKLH